jgi:glycosyltransferase involved in cell wall biosynthesis
VSARPRILFACPVTPAAGGNGLAMRAGLFLEGLARAGSVDVLVIPAFGAPADPGPLVAGHAASFEALEVPLADDPAARMRSLLATGAGRDRMAELAPLPPESWWASAPAAAEVAARAAGVQLVHVMRGYLAPALDALLDAGSRPLLSLDVDDVEGGALERHYLPRVDLVVAGSPRDADALAREHGLRSVEVITNAVRPVPDAKPPGAVDHDLVFVGNLSYGPNAEAARWLCQEVLPLLGAVRTAIVGSNPGPEVAELARLDGVTVAADVDAVAPWYAASRIAVAPLRSGRGTATKALEALAHRRPVVATTLGAAALDAAGANEGVLVADTPEGFAAACRRLLDSPQDAARLAERGREAVLRQATVDVVARRIGDLFGSMLAP